MRTVSATFAVLTSLARKGLRAAVRPMMGAGVRRHFLKNAVGDRSRHLPRARLHLQHRNRQSARIDRIFFDNRVCA